MDRDTVFWEMGRIRAEGGGMGSTEGTMIEGEESDCVNRIE
jgi:hypothetical protein